MKFLSRLGQILLQATKIITGLGPLIPGVPIAGIIQTFDQIAAIIVQVEVFGQALGLPGPEKLKAAGAAVTQIIMQSSLMAGKKLANPDLFRAGCTKIADGMADILNSLDDKIDTEDKT